MKMRMLITVTMLVAGVVTTALADTPARFAVVKRGESVYKLIYTGAAAEAIIAVKNRFDEVVFSERINSSNGFMLPLNFSGLQPGRYTVEVTSGKEKFTGVIEHGAAGSEANNKPFAAHVTRLKDARYLCSVRANAPVTLFVQNAQGETLATHSFTQSEGALVISLKKFSGRPIFVLQDVNGQTVTIQK